MPGVCHRCRRNVYVADEKNAWGKVWHNFCVSCRNCRKLLDECTAITYEDEIYCSKCYEDVTGEPHDSGEDADRRCGGRRSECCRRCPTPPASPARSAPCPAAVTTWYSRAHSREPCTDCVRCAAPEPWKTCDAQRACRPPPARRGGASGSSLCESCPGRDAVTSEPEEKDSSPPTSPKGDKPKATSCGCCAAKKQLKLPSTPGRVTGAGAAAERAFDKPKLVCDETCERAARRRSRRSSRSSSRGSSTTADGSCCRCSKAMVQDVYSSGGLKVVIKSPNFGEANSVDERPRIAPRPKSKFRSAVLRSSSPDGSCCSCCSGKPPPREVAQDCDCCQRTRSARREASAPRQRTSDRLRCGCCSQGRRVRTHSSSKASRCSKILRGNIDTSDGLYCSCSKEQHVRTRSSSKASRNSKRLSGNIGTADGLCCCCSQGQHVRTRSSSKASDCRKRFGGNVDVVAGGPCRRCGRQVYHAEMVLAAGTVFHTTCFSCRQCRKPLEPTTVCDAQGEIFCKQCYLKRFGPSGYGYGMGAGALQSP